MAESPVPQVQTLRETADGERTCAQFLPCDGRAHAFRLADACDAGADALGKLADPALRLVSVAALEQALVMARHAGQHEMFAEHMPPGEQSKQNEQLSDEWWAEARRLLGLVDEK